MKITTGIIFKAVPILSTLAVQQLPVKGAYGIAKTLLVLEPEMKIIKEKMFEIYKEYGAEEEGSNGKYIINPENEELAKAKLDALATIETEVPVHQLTLDDLGTEARLSSQDIIFIDFMFSK